MNKPANEPPAGEADAPPAEPPGPDYEELGIDPTFGNTDRARRIMGLSFIAFLVFLVGFAIWNG